MSSRSVAVRIKFGIDGCEVLRKALSDSPVVGFIAAMSEKEVPVAARSEIFFHLLNLASRRTDCEWPTLLWSR